MILADRSPPLFASGVCSSDRQNQRSQRLKFFVFELFKGLEAFDVLFRDVFLFEKTIDLSRRQRHLNLFLCVRAPTSLAYPAVNSLAAKLFVWSFAAAHVTTSAHGGIPFLHFSCQFVAAYNESASQRSST